MSVEINATNFPDSGLRSLISYYFDLDKDGILSDDEIAAATTLSISFPQEDAGITNSFFRGLNYLTSLETLEIDKTPSLTSVSLSGLPSVKTLNLDQNTNLKSVGVSGFTSLKELRLGDDTTLTTLSISNCPNLEILDLFNTKVSSIDLSYFTHLKYFRNSTSIKSLDFSSNTELVTLESRQTNVTSLTLGQHPDLETIYLDDNIGLSSINLSYCPSLVTVVLSNTKITSIDVTGCPDLEVLAVQGTGLTALDVTHCAKLQLLNLYSTKVASLDLGNNSKLTYLNAGLVSQLSSLNIAHLPVMNYLYKTISPLTATPNLIWRNSGYELQLHSGTVVTPADISIITQPVDTYGTDGANTIISLVASGSNLQYQWERKALSDSSWQTIEDENATSSISVLIQESDSGIQYRCLVYNNDGAIYSSAATVTYVTLPVITTQPTSKTVDEGSNDSIYVRATGVDLRYQWQVYDIDTDTWNDLSGITSNTYTFTAEASQNGKQYRCKVIENALSSINTENDFVLSDSATLTVRILYPPTIITQPQSITVALNQNAIFSVEAVSGVEGRKVFYAWYTDTKYTGQKYANDFKRIYSSGYGLDSTEDAQSNLIFKAATGLSGAKYKCKIESAGFTVWSDEVTLTIDSSNAQIIITRQPESVTVRSGNIVSFGLLATGNNLQFQWWRKPPDQVDNETTTQVFDWEPINGATGTTYSFIASTNLDGYKYRCVVSDESSSIASDDATLTINASGSEGTGTGSGGTGSGTGTGGTGIIYTGVGGGANDLYPEGNGTFDISDIELYGYHSIIISGRNTYGEWAMYPTSRPHVAAPDVKTNYVDIPGANGGLDYTEALTGAPTYGYRKGSWEFMLIPQDNWASVYRSLVSFLHGRRHTVILEDDLQYVYTGRLSVNKWESSQHYSTIVIDYMLDANAISLGSGLSMDDEEDLKAAARVLRKAKNAGKAIVLVNDYPVLKFVDYRNGDLIRF